jgi:hypothetical protein
MGAKIGLQKRVARARRYFSRADGWFYAAFLGLNAVLTLPVLIFGRNDDALFALPNLLRWGELAPYFEINLELAFLMAIWIGLGANWTRKTRYRFAGILITLVYASLIYASYASALRGIYQLEPNFFNDYAFISGGLPFFLTASDFSIWEYGAFLIGLGGLLGLIGFGMFRFGVDFPSQQLSRGPVLVFSGVALLGIWMVWFAAEFRGPFNSLTLEIAQNIQRSRVARQNVADLQIQNPFQVYDYGRYELREKPNIYLILIESYGSVLATREHFQQPYATLLAEFETRLTASDWQAVSTFSEAPTWGGGSWISYTAAMFGVDITVQREYEILKTDYQHIPYPHLGRYLQTQGYEYFWLAPIQLPLDADRVAADRNFYGADRWITFESMDFPGPVYGWGPAPADQYSLGFSHEIAQNNNQPDFVIYLTQNSHYPYQDLPPILADWRAFETFPPVDKGGEKETPRAFRQTRTDYINAITYTFEMLAQFILEISDPNSIIVLMGDHQPPAVSYKGDGFAVPVHVISQDAEFLTQFESYGFETGFSPSNTETALRHAGFYSLLVRNLVARYGVDPENLPPYLPIGMGE